MLLLSALLVPCSMNATAARHSAEATEQAQLHLLMCGLHSLKPCACATNCSRLLRPLPLGPHSSTAPPGTDKHRSKTVMRSKA